MWVPARVPALALPDTDAGFTLHELEFDGAGDICDGKATINSDALQVYKLRMHQIVDRLDRENEHLRFKKEKRFKADLIKPNSQDDAREPA